MLIILRKLVIWLVSVWVTDTNDVHYYPLVR